LPGGAVLRINMLHIVSNYFTEDCNEAIDQLIDIKRINKSIHESQSNHENT
jgi:hypothetical protein